MDQTWQRYRRALADEPLPAALVDLDALDANIARLIAPVRRGGKRLRLASKSIRCPALIDYISARADGLVNGLMTYTASETAFLVSQGARDLLLGYPTAQASDARLLAEANRHAVAAVVVDAVEQLDVLARAAAAAGTRIPVVVEVDLAYRPLGLGHLGVRRSPLRDSADVVAFAERVRATPPLEFLGLLGYEAQIAGVTDAGPHGSWQNPVRRGMKRLSRRDVEQARREVVAALATRGLTPTLHNGGGTGSLHWASAESTLTEVTAGSGFLNSQLFSYYAQLRLVPAAYFALQVVRRPATDLVACHGGGFVASGSVGPDRLPVPALPPGLRLLPREGAGEVQTPLAAPPGTPLALGDPVFFRHAKAGELAEHFKEYLLVRGDRIEARAPTYRGLGHCFLG